MAMKETADAEKALKHLNPDGEEDLLCSKTEHHPKEPMKLNSIPSEDQSKAEPWQSFKPKPGSVLPAKKRSVLRMMFDKIVQCFCSVSDDTNSPSASAGASETTSNANKVISNHVYPSP
ncbi:unnamed protein product [Prunus armeniaca]|uniref:Uncharacterized protein n=1 Tax=Prunus armeniaca TaxID=36596 RepID=A0A6J5VSK3_PRUAR|nr:unnamed protein product [Prunus armeniaca]CAB4291353.1 unnamed protein product [Prunus armeniaca]CAB4321663.1 unnamed protein product [Prunus armeniaca]